MLFLRRSFLFSRTSDAGSRESVCDDASQMRFLQPPAGVALTFLPHLHILADSNVFTPRFLDDPSVAVILPLPHLFQ